ncbi:MAG: sulfatase-like hydrolase/transferase [Verrucomicrobiota bacterium]
MSSTIHLIDLLPEAEVFAFAENHVEGQKMAIGRNIEMGIFQHPNSVVIFPELPLEGARLNFSIGIKDSSWERIVSPVIFMVGFATAGEKKVRAFFRRQIDVVNNAEDRRWFEETVEIPPLDDPGARLAFKTKVPTGDEVGFNWSGWGNPTLQAAQPIPIKTKATSKDDHHVLFITSDCLTRRYLGCYGNKEVATPNIDAFAKEGLVFDNAFAQSTVTPGSYACMLSGLHPSRHGLVAESQSFSGDVPSLPVFLQGRGYHTVMAPSESDMAHRSGGFPAIFNETFPCMANPAQEGGITTRRYLEWLGDRPDKPTFFWLHYFEPHPPVIPPARFREMYYEGDPSDPAREHRMGDIRELRGSECVLYFTTGLPWLKAGKPNPVLSSCLRETADAFLNNERVIPDLLPMLRSLGPSAIRGMTEQEFSAWLQAQLPAAEGNGDPTELIEWIEEVLPSLREIERDALNWLKDVKDFHFPVEQFKGAISFVDSLVGDVLSRLREEGLYEQTTIILTSPHGEAIDSVTTPFEHHAPLPEVLELPLLIKPASSLKIAPRRIDGTFGSIDLTPTVCELLGFEWTHEADGISHAGALLSGSPLPERTSFALDLAGVAASATSRSHVLMKSLGGKALRPDTYIEAGDYLVANRSSGHIDIFEAPHLPEEFAALAEELDVWIRGNL